VAYALVAHSATKSNSGNGFTTAALDTSGGDTLFLVLAETSGGTSTISDSKANTWVQRTAQSFVGQVSIWYALNAACGTGHTFTVTGTSTFPSICYAAFSGGKSSGAYDVENGNTAAAATSIQPGSVTPSENSEIVISGYSCNDDRNSQITINSPMTLLDHIGAESFGSSMSALAYEIQTTATARNPTWSWTDSEYCQSSIATFRSAPSGPPTIGISQQMDAAAQSTLAAMMR